MTATLTELDAPGVGDRSETRRIPLPLALLAASLPMFMATLDNLVMTSALPVIQRSLHADISHLEWFINAYTLSFATLMLAAATLGDRWGRRRMFPPPVRRSCQSPQPCFMSVVVVIVAGGVSAVTCSR